MVSMISTTTTMNGVCSKTAKRELRSLKEELHGEIVELWTHMAQLGERLGL